MNKDCGDDQACLGERGRRRAGRGHVAVGRGLMGREEKRRRKRRSGCRRVSSSFFGGLKKKKKRLASYT